MRRCTLWFAAAGLERDLDLAIGVGDGGGGAEGEIDAAVGQADVVEDELDLRGRDQGADLALDGGEVLLGVLDAHALGRVDVQAHLAGVDIGEEVAADEEEQGKREEDEDAEGEERERRGCPGTTRGHLVAVTHAFELVIEALMPAPDPVVLLFALGRRTRPGRA